ncbi:MAG: transposase [Xanthomonadales bacterium]|nr:transposase [Xanthomonadales bacterium]
MRPDLNRPGYATLRRGRCSVPGWCYLVTTVTVDRTPWFACADAAMAVTALQADAALLADARLLSWVLMPDHWHGVLQLGSTTSLSRVVNRFKTCTAMRANALLQRKGPLWFQGFHDRALRNELELDRAREYIRMNPVRAGLCERAEDYPYRA